MMNREMTQTLIQELASLKQRISELEEELRESEEKYQNVLENIEDGYFEVDRAGDFTSFNTSLCRILGYTKKEMLGMNYKVLTDAENVKNVFRAFNEIYQTGIPSKLFEWEAIRKDGAKKCVEVSVSLIVTPGEKPTRFRGIARDITDRKEAEEKLLESEEKYRNILDSIEDGYFEVDIAGNLTFFNDSVCRILGKTRAELMGMNNRQYTDKENSQILYQAFNEVFRTGEPSKGVTYQIIGKDGIKLYIESSVSLIRNTSGQPIGFRGIMRNINERKRAEEAIVLARNDWENTFYNVTDMITIHDEDFNIVRANPAARALFGLQLQEGMPLVKCFRCYHGTENPPTGCASCQSLQTGKPSTVEMFEPYLNKHLEIRAMPRFGSDGRLIGLIHVVRDITERKRIEAETASLADIGRVIGSTLDIDEVYERMVAEIRKLILFDSLRVNLINAQQEMLHVAYVFGLDIPSRRVGDSYPMQGTILAEVIRTRRGMILQSEDPKDLIDKFPSLIVSVRAGLRSIMTVPLISRDELIGTLLLRSKKPVAYTEHDLHLAERIGMQIAGAIANAQLFNDLSKTEKSLRESEELFRSYLEYAPDGVYMSDLQGNFLYGNRKCEEIIGYRREELIGKNFLELNILPEKSLNKAAQLLQANIEGKSTGPDEIELISKEGRIIPVEISTSVVRQMGQRIILAFVRNITDRKRAEKRSAQE